LSTKSNYTILFSINQGDFQKVAEYRKLRLQQKAKNRDNPISPATVNREEKKGQAKNPYPDIQLQGKDERWPGIN
jgi:hypothetical protein